jgi:hypothetical protein
MKITAQFSGVSKPLSVGFTLILLAPFGSSLLRHPLCRQR